MVKHTLDFEYSDFTSDVQNVFQKLPSRYLTQNLIAFKLELWS